MSTYGSRASWAYNCLLLKIIGLKCCILEFTLLSKSNRARCWLLVVMSIAGCHTMSKSKQIKISKWLNDQMQSLRVESRIHPLGKGWLRVTVINFDHLWAACRRNNDNCHNDSVRDTWLSRTLSWSLLHGHACIRQWHLPQINSGRLSNATYNICAIISYICITVSKYRIFWLFLFCPPSADNDWLLAGVYIGLNPTKYIQPTI